MTITLYTKPDCQPCRMTKRKLAGHDYTEVDVTKDPAALAYVKDTLGYTGAPVVYVSTPNGDTHWYGLNIQMIEQHITKRADAA